jgi:phosphoribosylanthranilate isomerase
MLVQIYEISSAQEAAALSQMGVEHIGVLVGDGSFPRELSVASALKIAGSVAPPSRLCALFLSSDMARVAEAVRQLRPSIVHLGAAPELLGPEQVVALKRAIGSFPIMRSVPVTGPESLGVARSYEGIADFVLLDSYSANDRQIGALGVPHDWNISRQIARSLTTPVLLAGGLGPDNVAEAIRVVGPDGVDAKTKTDKPGTHVKDLERVKAFLAAAKSAASPCKLPG